MSFGCTVAILHSDTAIVYYISIYTTGNTYRSVSVTHLLLEGSSRLAQWQHQPKPRENQKTVFVSSCLFRLLPNAPLHRVPNSRTLLYLTFLGHWSVGLFLEPYYTYSQIQSVRTSVLSVLYCILSMSVYRPTDRPTAHHDCPFIIRADIVLCITSLAGSRTPAPFLFPTKFLLKQIHLNQRSH